MGAALHRFFASWRFPIAALTLLVGYKLLLLAMLLAPVGDSALGQFAEQFKTWCFGYDPATGHVVPVQAVMMLTEPLALGALIALVWWGQLRPALRSPRQLWPVVAGAAGVVVTAALALFLLSPPPSNDSELPFPAEALRTSYPAPALSLIDQDGRPARLQDERGRVVLLTAVYAHCGYACPMILRDAKAAVASLSETERGRVRVLAVTLDPERDTPAELAKLAAAQRVEAPLFRFLSGPPAQVNALLDQLGFERRRDPQTGVIDHPNVFLVIDREGRIAYRLSQGGRQQRWLAQSLQFLLQAPGQI